MTKTASIIVAAAIPFVAMAFWPLLAYGLGLRFRSVPAAHGRFMLCTAIPLIDPVIGRILACYFPPLPSLWLYQVVTFSIATAVAAGLVFTYRGPATARRALAAYFVAFVVLEVGWFLVAPTPMWLEAVRWFRALPLT